MLSRATWANSAWCWWTCSSARRRSSISRRSRRLASAKFLGPLLDPLFQFFVGLPQLFFGLRQTLGLPSPLQRSVDHGGQQFHERRALDKVIVGAPFHHFHGHAFAAVSGSHDERHTHPFGGDLLQQLAAAHVGQAVVQQHQVGGMLPEPRQGGEPVGHARRAMAAGGQPFFDQPQQGGIIFDDEDHAGPAVRWGRAKTDVLDRAVADIVFPRRWQSSLSQTGNTAKGGPEVA